MRHPTRSAVALLLFLFGSVPVASAAPPERCRTYEDGCHTYYTRYESGHETIAWECADGSSGSGAAVPGTFAYHCPRVIA
ncbi:MAG: hypothetical protein AAFQ43_03805 [Bacteroidota bacterium]